MEGQVKGLQSRSELRSESGSASVWSFRIERYDESGNRVQLIPVEMRALGFEGSLSDGDWVRARGRMRRGTFVARQVENVTTGATVQAKQAPAVVKAIAVVMVAVVLAFLGWVGYVALTTDSARPDGFEMPEGFISVGAWGEL